MAGRTPPPGRPDDRPDPGSGADLGGPGASGLARLRRRGVGDLASLIGHEVAGVARYGTATRSRVRTRGPDGAHGNESARYRTIALALDLLADPATGPVPQGTFLDVGCGSGRVLQVAARRWPGPVIGLERDPTTAATARLACRRLDVEVVEADATTAPLGPEVGAIFLFNPFGAKATAAFAERVAESLATTPRPLRVAYAVPKHLDEWRERWPACQVRVVRDTALIWAP